MAGLTRQLAGLLVLAATAQAKIYDTRFDGTTWDDSNWRVATTNLDQGHYQARMSLSNGYLGINLAAVGPFFEVDVPVNGDDISGWPLFDRRQTFATISGFFDEQPTTNGTNFEWLNQYGGESVISGVPHWSGLHVKAGDNVLTADVPSHQISNFKSTLDMKAGTLGWNYTWTPPNSGAIQIEYLMFVHKLYVNQAAVQLKMTAKKDTNVTVIDVLNGDCAVRTTFAKKSYGKKQPVIWSAVRPNGINNVTAYFYSELAGDKSADMSGRTQFTEESIVGGNRSSIAQAVPVSLKAGKTSTITKYVGGASTDAFPNPHKIARTASSKAKKSGFRKLLASHTKEWRSIMTDDSVDSYRFPENNSLPNDPNVIELQITAVTNPFQLLQNTVGANAIAKANNNPHLDVNSIAVGGLGSDSYAGFIFWDAEVWMAPGLVVAFPQAAKQIAQYRVKTFPQAQRNVKTAFTSSQNKTGKFSPNGAVYPWTSSRYGNCTGTGPCFDYEYHINGDIGLELYNYYTVTGDTDYFRKELFPIYDAVAQFYSDLVTLNATSKKYDLYNATDPDEYANFQTNVGYTMVLMHTHIDNANVLRARLGMKPNSAWEKVSSAINIPVDKDANIILEYQNMNGSIQVKQADVVLVDDLLDYPNPYTLSDLDYYAGKQSLNGPGMTYGVFSIIANAHSPSGCASYTYDLYGSQPYTRAPWFQFSEQLIDDFTLNGGTHPAYPFLTGMGGANRVAVYGYLGLKLTLDSLNVNPNLPPQIPHLEYRTIYWQGWPIKATSNQTHTTLTRPSGKLSNANSTFANAPIPVTVGVSGTGKGSNPKILRLQPGGSLTLANRDIASNQTVPGNIAQCASANSSSPYAVGQFPLSAIDGATSTKWQPESPSTKAALTVTLPGDSQPITSLHFDWAQNPPKSFTVTFSNSTKAATSGSGGVVVATQSNVKVSNPYVARKADDIVPYASNTTDVVLKKPVWSGRYATLVIQGNQGSGENGGTVAEFAIVGKEGKVQ